MGDINISPNTLVKINKDSLLGYLKITNLSLERKAFKIKTTRPKDYLVKPSIGILQPKVEKVIEVNILELIKIDDSHKFAIEIYDINWRQNVDTLKSYLKSTQISPLLIHRLGVQYEDQLNNENVEKHQVPKNEENDLKINVICLSYLTILIIILFFQLFKQVDN